MAIATSQIVRKNKVLDIVARYNSRLIGLEITIIDKFCQSLTRQGCKKSRSIPEKITTQSNHGKR